MIKTHRPKTLDHALQLYAADPALLPVAGATDVYPAKTARAGWGRMKHPDVLDLTGIQRMAAIVERDAHWELGALTTWSALARASQLPPLFDGLKAAACEIGGVQIQNRGTIAGNIVTASPAGDSIPCLLTLDAEVVLASAAEDRIVPLASFIDGYRHTQLKPGELVAAIRIPKSKGHGHFLKLGARRYLVISIAMVAAVFEFAHPGPIVTSARIAVGACSAVAQRLHALEQDLIGKPLATSLVEPEHVAHLTPLDDVRASADYRRAAALQLVRDIIERAITTQGRS